MTPFLSLFRRRNTSLVPLTCLVSCVVQLVQLRGYDHQKKIADFTRMCEQWSMTKGIQEHTVHIGVFIWATLLKGVGSVRRCHFPRLPTEVNFGTFIVRYMLCWRGGGHDAAAGTNGECVDGGASLTDRPIDFRLSLSSSILELGTGGNVLA